MNSFHKNMAAALELCAKKYYDILRIPKSKSQQQKERQTQSILPIVEVSVLS